LQKTYVLDTNVLLQSPSAILAFGDNIIIIPEVVLEELDRFKKENSELGANARHAARFLDKLRESGKLNEGVELENGGIVRIEMNRRDYKLPFGWDSSKNDNRILQVCKCIEEETGEKVYLVTKDVFQRIKADVVGVIAQDFFSEQVPSYEEQYKGRIDVYAAPEKISEFFQNKMLSPQDVRVFEDTGESSTENGLEVNQFVIIRSVNNPKQTALGRFDGTNIVPLKYLDQSPFGVNPRNVGQKFMQEALMEGSGAAPLVIIKGPAGTAKTFYSLAVGLEKLMGSSEKEYRKILVCRPNIKMDEDIGFLPGTEQEKIAPYMRPIIDNLEILLDNDEAHRYGDEAELSDKVEELFERNIINTESIAYLRGRSIVKQWIIIDEAQNLTPRQVKGIITRAGSGTKLILVGDPAQIDHPFLDSRTNGLCYAAEKMKGSPLCYQISLFEDECERSDLAHEGAKRM
jgi:PhoH-like ATPase